MKDKNVAGILALFFGALGIHRFYLGQIGLGILYLFFFWFTWFIGLIDAIAFFAMDKDDFDYRYNRIAYPTSYPREQYNRRDQYDSRRNTRPEHRDPRRSALPAPSQQRQRSTPPPSKKPNPFTQSGLEKFKDFDYDGAINDFEKALEFDPKDVALHWNLACAYSLTENADKAFFHLDRAVVHGFNDAKRIKEHDALAFLRIQKEFENFEKNGFRLVPPVDLPKDPVPKVATAPELSPDLLEQLNKLGSLREKGLLTEEEFSAQKRKLLG